MFPVFIHSALIYTSGDQPEMPLNYAEVESMYGPKAWHLISLSTVTNSGTGLFHPPHRITNLPLRTNCQHPRILNS